MEEGKGKELEMREETKLDPNESPYKKKKKLSLNSSARTINYYPRRARSALGVDIVLTFMDVCLYVCMLPL